jgi:quercetin dioxygenase-like cupin family protein
MNSFPAFMKNDANRVDSSSQFTEDIEGFVFDGGDGSQMIIWTCNVSRKTSTHVHAFDEYMVVVAGQYSLWLEEKEHVLGPGDEIYIPKGTSIRGACSAGTRTIHAFEKQRARRAIA